MYMSMICVLRSSIIYDVDKEICLAIQYIDEIGQVHGILRDYQRTLFNLVMTIDFVFLLNKIV